MISKKVLLGACFWLVVYFAAAQKIIGGKNNDYPSKIIEYSNDVFFIVGTTKNNSTDGSDDLFLLKNDLNISQLSFKIIGDKYTDRGYGIYKLSDGNILVTGESRKTFNEWGGENAFLLKMDTYLETIWSKGYYAPMRDAGLTCKELTDGNLLLVGYTRSYNIEPNSIGNVYVLKTTATGDTIWHKAFNSAGNDYGFDFCEIDSGHIVVLAEAGGFFNSNQADYRFSHDADIMLIELDTNGNELRRVYWGGNGHDLARQIIKAPDSSGYFIVGSTQSFGNGNFDMLLLKLDNDFNEEWHKTLGDELPDYGNAMCLSKDKNQIVVAGTSDNASNGTLIRITAFDLNGVELWQKQLSIDTFTCASDIIATNDYNFALVGYTGKYFDDYNIFFTKLSEDGLILKQTANYALVYPNPVRKGNDLTFKIVMNDGEQLNELSIFNSVGRLVWSSRFENRIYRLNSKILTQGIYFYKIMHAEQLIYSGKFIVY